LLTEPSVLGSAYPVTLPSFEGPLDLLLQLIEKEELDISEVSLVAVTDQYLQTIEQMSDVEAGALADFLVIASRLLFIKSRALLPKTGPVEDDEEEDSADALVRQLLEYRMFKEIANQLRDREEEGLRSYIRLAPRPEIERRLDLSDVDLEKLHRALRRALARIPSDPPLPRVKTYTITVAEQIENVRSFVFSRVRRASGEAAPVSFTELLSRNRTRMEVIVTFLAVLELIKQREILAEQDATFGEIMLLPGESHADTGAEADRFDDASFEADAESVNDEGDDAAADVR
jgi:segregation and condensation protein A